MILLWLLGIPTAGGLLAWLLGRVWAQLPRWVAVVTLAADLAAALWLLRSSMAGVTAAPGDPWFASFDVAWIPQLGIHFFVAMDGLSLILVLMTVFMGIMALASAWKTIRERTGFFYFNLLWVVAGITGVFLALDLFLFYFFWEMMLVPMYFIIAVWGHENRAYAAVKFFLFTQISGLFMLLAIVALYFVHGHKTGDYTFNYLKLLGTALSPAGALWLMLGFLSAFAIKLPIVPFHAWLPDAYTAAPTPGSIILAALMAKTAAYGLVRFVVPLFPGAALDFAPYAMGLAVASILYGAVLAFAQSDLKRLVAYISVSHMGYIMLGVFAWNRIALQGVVMLIVSHAVSTGALFMLSGALEERLHTRDMQKMGGLWATAPRLGGITMVFAQASLGLPGLGNFVAEFLVLLGTFRVSVPAAILATLGLIVSTVYAVWIIQRVFHGPNLEGRQLPELSGRETSALAVMILVILWLGLYPQPVLRAARPPLAQLERLTAPAAAAGRLVETVQAARGPLVETQSALQTGGRP